MSRRMASAPAAVSQLRDRPVLTSAPAERPFGISFTNRRKHKKTDLAKGVGCAQIGLRPRFETEPGAEGPNASNSLFADRTLRATSAPSQACLTSVGLGDRARKSRGSQPKPVGAVISISFWSARQRWRGSNITPPSRTERLTRSCGVSAPPTAGVPARWIRDPLPLLDRRGARCGLVGNRPEAGNLDNSR